MFGDRYLRCKCSHHTLWPAVRHGIICAMTHISEKDTHALRDALEKERTELEQSLAEHGKKIDGDWQGATQGSQENEADPIDAADTLEELATNVPLVEELERRYKDVVDALEKITAGTYGLDENTNEPISLERLRANPAARTAIA